MITAPSSIPRVSRTYSPRSNSYTPARKRKEMTPVFGSSNLTAICHSPESWTELWDGTVFTKGEVEVEVDAWPFLIAGQTLDKVWFVRRL
ncbi:hypothetical protein EDD16DRAFT_1659440 [Pisolithus croceorrhizus]|nr:hypothetical protein EV401DRAFT_2038896 [Pisolithus croceorrhizus]KAI6099294.1 hypothetical protein EDD16DRAFT_1659440 [Pisolithus croceorrhizus]